MILVWAFASVFMVLSPSSRFLTVAVAVHNLPSYQVGGAFRRIADWHKGYVDVTQGLGRGASRASGESGLASLVGGLQGAVDYLCDLPDKPT